jgi:hypothetical protein
VRTIVIVCRESNQFDVHCDTAFMDRLSWDECLGQVAVLTHPKMNVEPRFPPYRMSSLDGLREEASEKTRRLYELEREVASLRDQLLTNSLKPVQGI